MKRPRGRFIDKSNLRCSLQPPPSRRCVFLSLLFVQTATHELLNGQPDWSTNMTLIDMCNSQKHTSEPHPHNAIAHAFAADQILTTRADEAEIRSAMEPCIPDR